MSKSVTTESLIEEFNYAFDACESMRELVTLGVNVFSIKYIDTVHRNCLKTLRKNMHRLSPGDAGRTVVAVDFEGIFRAMHALDELGCAAKTVSKIHSIRETISHSADDMFIVALDAPTNWRKTRHPGYKSSRDAKPVGMAEIRQKAICDLEKDGIRTEIVPDMEADDVMASIAFAARCRMQKCFLVTEDKDFWQCLGTGIAIYAPRADEYRNADWLMANHQITPEQVVDWLCLVGKDDAPTPHGIGASNASEWLAKHENFWRIYASRSTLTEKKRKLVEDFADAGYSVAYDIHQLKNNLPIYWDVPD